MRCASPNLSAKISERMTRKTLPIIGPANVPAPPMIAAMSGSNVQAGLNIMWIKWKESRK